MSSENDDDKKARIRERVRQRRLTKHMDVGGFTPASRCADQPATAGDAEIVPHARTTAAGDANRSAIPLVEDLGAATPQQLSTYRERPQEEPVVDVTRNEPPAPSQAEFINQVLESMQQMNNTAQLAAEAAKDAAGACVSAVSAADHAAQAAVKATAGGRVVSLLEGGSAKVATLETENADLKRQASQLRTEIEQLDVLKEKNGMLDHEMDRFSREFSQLASRKQELEIRNQQLEGALDKASVDTASMVQIKTEMVTVKMSLEQTLLDKATAEQQRDAFAAETAALKAEMNETERDLEETIEKEAILDKANQRMKAQIARASQLIHENEALKDDQALLTQELKRMQMEMQQKKDNASNGPQDSNAIQERDEWQRKYDGVTDEHTVQLAEFAKREAQREQQQQELLRANLEFTQASHAQTAELNELRARNEELVKHVTELEVDLQHSDAGAVRPRVAESRSAALSADEFAAVNCSINVLVPTIPVPVVARTGGTQSERARYSFCSCQIWRRQSTNLSPTASHSTTPKKLTDKELHKTAAPAQVWSRAYWDSHPLMHSLHATSLVCT
jgi:myosin heavy subunit